MTVSFVQFSLFRKFKLTLKYENAIKSINFWKISFTNFNPLSSNSKTDPEPLEHVTWSSL